MDPNANLLEQDNIIRAGWFRVPDPETARAEEDRLRELRHALRQWIARGGFEPEWSHYQVAATAYRHWLTGSN